MPKPSIILRLGPGATFEAELPNGTCWTIPMSAQGIDLLDKLLIGQLAPATTKYPSLHAKPAEIEAWLAANPHRKRPADLTLEDLGILLTPREQST